MMTDERASRNYSEGLSLIEQGIRKLRVGVEIERTLRGRAPDEGNETPARLSPCARTGMKLRTDVQ